MGVKDLWKQIRKQCPDILREIDPLREYKGRRLCWDVAVDMHAMIDCRDGVVTWFVDRLTELRRAGIELVPIFDGDKRGIIKKHEHERREKARQQADRLHRQRGELETRLREQPASATEEQLRAIVREVAPASERVLDRHTRVLVGWDGPAQPPRVELDRDAIVATLHEHHERVEARTSVTPQHYRDLRAALDEIGWPYLVADTEAEKLGAELVARGEFAAIITSDGDALMFAEGSRVVRNFFKDQQPAQEICTRDLVDGFGLGSYAELVEFCLLCGTDFTDAQGIPLVGPVKALKIVLKHGTIDAFLGSLDWTLMSAKLARSAKWSGFSIDQFDHVTARRMITSSDPPPRRFNWPAALDDGPAAALDEQQPPAKKRRLN